MAPRLVDLRAFAAVARQRSFRAAADTLGVSRSALSHRVIDLERELGVCLLNRTTRSAAPTEAGERLAHRLEPLLAGLAALDLVTEAPSGTVRINCMEWAAKILPRWVVPAVLERYSGVAVEIVTDGRLVDIVAAGFNAGVRLRESVPQDMIAMPFGGEVRFLDVAAPAYLDRHGTPATTSPATAASASASAAAGCNAGRSPVTARTSASTPAP